MNRRELVVATKSGNALAFVDVTLLDQIDGEEVNAPIVGILEHAPGQALAGTVRALDSAPWLSHVISAAMLSTPRARTHVENLLQRLAVGVEHAMLGSTGIGRTALLASASRREARFDRMREFFGKQGLQERAIARVIDVAEELVMNALYNAPAEAGYFQRVRQRFEDVTLPPDRACEISYGIDGDTVFLRLRDPFGALLRSRLIEVLTRCNSSDVELDESRGGAGLGIWRVFQAVSTISITVVPGALTEFLVGIDIKDGRKAARASAVHLFFGSGRHSRDALPFVVADDDLGLVDQSITLVHVT